MKVIWTARPPWIVLFGFALLLGLIAWQGLTYLDNRQEDQRRAEVVATAEAQVRDLIGLNTDNVAENLKALENRTTGEFRRQLSGLTQVFVSTVTQQKISAEGRIVGVGVESLDPGEAKVLVAAVSKVTTVKKEKPVTHGYRLRIVLKDTRDGWRVGGMEFVP